MSTGEPDLERVNLRVYPPRPCEVSGEAGVDGCDVWWAPGLGLVRRPPGWVFLPRGECFVTRKVNEWGRYWLVVRRRPRQTETPGLLAPEEAVAEARRLAEETEEVRGRRRAASARAWERAAGRQYQEMLAWPFARVVPRHQGGGPGGGGCLLREQEETLPGLGRRILLEVEDRLRRFAGVHVVVPR